MCSKDPETYSLLIVWTAVCLAKSPTHRTLCSPQDTISLCLGWNRVLDTLLQSPLQKLISQAYSPDLNRPIVGSRDNQ